YRLGKSALCLCCSPKGLSTSEMYTSRSRAGDRLWVTHLSSALTNSVWGPATMFEQNDVAARKRRSPMRIWCNASESRDLTPASLAKTCVRHDRARIRNASAALVRG